jgi:hypothetical protein
MIFLIRTIRYDQEIVDFLNENDVNYIDMNLVQLKILSAST